MGKSSKLNWEDLYYDGWIDSQYEIFDEETQKIHRGYLDDGWDNIEKIRSKKRKGYAEDASDEWYLKMKNGKIKRK